MRVFFLVCIFITIGISALVAASAIQPHDDFSQDVRAGYEIWRENGCEGCHTIYGQGGNYAPDLSKIYSARGDSYLREFMLQPAAFHPDQRVMPRFHLSSDAIIEVIAFLEWVDAQPEADWSPRSIQVAGMGGLQVASTNTALSPNENTALTQGQQIYSSRCASCHSLEPGVTLAGPSLAGIADRAWQRVIGQGAEEYIRNSILYPDEYLVEGFTDVMQKNFAEVMSSQELDALLAFLMTLEEAT